MNLNQTKTNLGLFNLGILIGVITTEINVDAVLITGAVTLAVLIILITISELFK